MRLTVELADGEPSPCRLAWYPRLWHGSREERSHWRLIGDGRGIHWPDLDEDINVEGLLQGRHSGETQTSLKRWLEGRGPAKQDHTNTIDHRSGVRLARYKLPGS